MTVKSPRNSNAQPMQINITNKSDSKVQKTGRPSIRNASIRNVSNSRSRYYSISQFALEAIQEVLVGLPKNKSPLNENINYLNKVENANKPQLIPRNKHRAERVVREYLFYLVYIRTMSKEIFEKKLR